MKLKIRGIIDPGIVNKERLVIDVMQDEDIGYYLVFDTILLSNDNISTALKHTFWFPDKKVKAGDLVVLYTKKGVQSETHNTNGTTSHFFYWGFENVFWTQASDSVTLLELKSWAVEKALKT